MTLLSHVHDAIPQRRYGVLLADGDGDGDAPGWCFLGVATGIIALLAGSMAAAAAAKQILNINFVFDGSAALITVLGGGAATLLFGLLGALAALRARPAARLRNG